jgi:hypothetical protein
MKGLNKYIINSVIDHARVYDFEQFLFFSRHVEKDFGIVLKQIKFDGEHVKRSVYSLHSVKYQTQKLCLYAVKTFGMSLECVKEKTYEICLEAVKKNGFSIKFVNEPTEEILFLKLSKKVH